MINTDLQEIGSKIVELIIEDEDVENFDQQLEELANRFSFKLTSFQGEACMDCYS